MAHGGEQGGTTGLARLDDGDHLLGVRPQPAETFTGYGRTTTEDRARTLALLERLATKMADDWHVLSAAGRDNPRIPAGYTYLGQLLAHDVSFEPAPLPSGYRAMRPAANLNSAALDLDCIYGGGPRKSPLLYRHNGVLPREKLRLGRTAPDPAGRAERSADDLPRVRLGDAATATDAGAGTGCPYETLLADPRNEDILILSQLTVLFIKLHNRMVDAVRRTGGHAEGSERVFGIARRITCDIYRSVIANDFLRVLMWPEVWRGYCQKVAVEEFAFFGRHAGQRTPAALPVEFTVAALRVGHAMVRSTYAFNSHHAEPGAELGLLMTFKPEAADGRVPVTADWVIDWQRFFPPMGETADGYAPLPGAADVTFSQRLAPVTTPALFHSHAFAPPAGHRAEPFATSPGLFYRDFARAYDLGLPNGQAMAKAFGVPQLGRDVLRRMLAPKPRFIAPRLDERDIRTLADDTPLLYYLLAEAEETAGGRHLGRLGSSIIGEVLFGLLALSRRPAGAELQRATAAIFADRPVPETMHEVVALVQREDASQPGPSS